MSWAGWIEYFRNRIMSTILYIGAIALQLAGALILLKRFDPRKVKDTVLKEIKKDRDNTAMVWNESDGAGLHHTEERETLQNKAEELYLNGVAFGYLAAGYILGIFGYTEVNKWLVAFCVIVVAIVLMLLGITVCKHYAKKNFPENIEVHDE